MSKRNRSTRGALVAIPLAMSLVLAACGSSTAKKAATASPGSSAPSASKAPVQVDIGYYEGSFYTWLVDLAQQAGFFTKNGIDAHMTAITGGGAIAFAGLAHGSIDIAMGDTTLGGPYMDKGIHLRVISGASTGGWVLVAPKSEKLAGPYPEAVRGLKGKSIGVVALGTSSYYYAKQLVTDAGLPAGSVTYQALGGVPAELVAAVDGGRVSAAMADPVTAYLLVVLDHNQAIISTGTQQASIFGTDDNPQTLLPASSPLRSVQGTVGGGGWEWTTDSFAKSHPGAIKRFQLAVEETDVWMHNPANLQAVAADLEQGGNIPKFVLQAKVTTQFLEAILPLVTSYVSPEAIGAFQTYWVGKGLLTKTVPLSEWYTPGIPQSPEAVVAAVDAAGQSSLGLKA